MLSAVWRRVEDHRRHRGACGDSQDPHASGLARARDAVTLRRIQPSRVDTDPEESREWGTCTQHRAIDRLSGRRYSRRQSKEAFKFPVRRGKGRYMDQVSRAILSD